MNPAKKRFLVGFFCTSSDISDTPASFCPISCMCVPETGRKGAISPHTIKFLPDFSCDGIVSQGCNQELCLFHRIFAMLIPYTHDSLAYFAARFRRYKRTMRVNPC